MEAALSSDFPATATEFWVDKPPDVSPWSWLFHPLNPFRFTSWVARLLNKIRYYSQQSGWTLFYQRTIAGWLGITEQWLREIIDRLKLVGVVADRKIKKSRQYRLNEMVLKSQPAGPSCGESFGDTGSKKAASITDTESCGEPSASYMKHHDQYSRSEGTIIMGDDGKPDPVVEAFQQATGTRYRAQRDAAARAQMRRFPTIAVIAGILLSRLRCPNGQINSLAYCLPAVREVVQAQATTIRNAVGTHADARTLSGGGLMEYVRFLRKKLAKLQRE
jgi:hypothetical protein